MYYTYILDTSHSHFVFTLVMEWWPSCMFIWLPNNYISYISNSISCARKWEEILSRNIWFINCVVPNNNYLSFVIKIIFKNILRKVEYVVQSPKGNNIKIKRIMGVGFFDVIRDLCVKEKNTCKPSMREQRDTYAKTREFMKILNFMFSICSITCHK